MIGMRARPQPIPGDERACCPRCGRGIGVGIDVGARGHGIPIEGAIAAIALDPELIGAMDADSCPRCGASRGWDVVRAPDVSRGEDGGPAARRETVLAIRGQLAIASPPAAAAAWIRDELGVVGILVEDRSELGRALGADWTTGAPGPGPARPRRRSTRRRRRR